MIILSGKYNLQENKLDLWNLENYLNYYFIFKKNKMERRVKREAKVERNTSFR